MWGRAVTRPLLDIGHRTHESTTAVAVPIRGHKIKLVNNSNTDQGGDHELTLAAVAAGAHADSVCSADMHSGVFKEERGGGDKKVEGHVLRRVQEEV